MRSLLVVLVILTSSSARGTPPCEHSFGMLDDVLMPADGSADVPVNATPVVRAEYVDAIGLSDGDGVPLPFRVETFTADNGFARTPFVRLIPEGDLPAEELIRVVAGDESLATFATGTERDEDAPSAPVPTATGEPPEGACPPLTIVSLARDDDTAIVFPSSRLVGELRGLSVDDQLILSGERDEEMTVPVAAMDLAGNVSAAVQVTVTLSSGTGCAATRSSEASLFALLCGALALAQRRRRTR